MPDRQSLGDSGITQVTELIRLADRFGLTWGRRPGTVVSVTSSFTGKQASVVMDGDDHGVTVVSLAGILQVDDRVMVDRVPPAGLYVVAILNRDTPLPSPEDTPMSVAAESNGPTVTVPTVALVIPSGTLITGSVYRVEVGAGMIGPPDSVFSYALHKGSTVAGTLWARSQAMTVGGGTLISDAPWVAYVTPSVTLTTDVSLVVNPPAGGVTQSGTALSPRYVSLTRVALSADAYPQAVTVA